MTGSRKKARRRAACPDVDRLNWQDEMHGHCRRLNTLAEVLGVAGPALEPPVIEGIGDLLGREIRAIEALLEKVWPEGAR